jgi:hypothetical protein
MKCKIEGCDRAADYKADQVCQKHYFRMIRYGTYELTRSRKYRISNPAGYQKIYEPLHPLANSDGYVYEHRKVYFDQVSSVVSGCDMCSDPQNWESCHIDHIDDDVTNNGKENLRVTCRACNVFRAHTADSMGKVHLTVNGVTMSAHAWARQEGVRVAGNTIRRRKMSGMSDYESVYGEKITHRNSAPKSKPLKYDKARGIGRAALCQSTTA